jgi:hypothetical protein
MPITQSPFALTERGHLIYTNVATMHTAASVFMKIIRHTWVACVCICLLLISVVFSNEWLSDWYTQCGSEVLRLIFLKIEDMWKTHTFFIIQNKLHWHIYRLLHGNTVSEKLLQIPLFGPSLIHQLQLLGSSNIRKVESFYFIFNLGNRK